MIVIIFIVELKGGTHVGVCMKILLLMSYEEHPNCYPYVNRTTVLRYCTPFNESTEIKAIFLQLWFKIKCFTFSNAVVLNWSGFSLSAANL